MSSTQTPSAPVAGGVMDAGLLNSLYQAAPGARMRSQPARAIDYINLADFVMFDGSDQNVGLQLAFDTAKAQGKGVFHPGGVVYSSKAINVSSYGVSILGTGTGQAAFRFDVSNGFVIDNSGSNSVATPVVCTNVQFLTGSVNAYTAFNLTGSPADHSMIVADLNLYNCSFGGSAAAKGWLTDLDLTNVTDSQVTDCRFNGAQTGATSGFYASDGTTYSRGIIMRAGCNSVKGKGNEFTWHGEAVRATGSGVEPGAWSGNQTNACLRGFVQDSTGAGFRLHGNYLGTIERGIVFGDPNIAGAGDFGAAIGNMLQNGTYPDGSAPSTWVGIDVQGDYVDVYNNTFPILGSSALSANATCIRVGKPSGQYNHGCNAARVIGNRTQGCATGILVNDSATDAEVLNNKNDWLGYSSSTPITVSPTAFPVTRVRGNTYMNNGTIGGDYAYTYTTPFSTIAFNAQSNITGDATDATLSMSATSDPSGIYTNSATLTIKRAGIYHIDANIIGSGVTSSQVGVMRLRVNGGNRWGEYGAFGQGSLSLHATLALAKGDTLSFILNFSGGSKGVSTTASSSDSIVLVTMLRET